MNYLVSVIQACFIFLSGLERKAFDHFHAPRNVPSYTVLCYWPEFVIRFLSKYATITANFINVMLLIDLKQLPGDTVIELNARVREIAYRFGSRFFMNNQISALAFGIHLAIHLPATNNFENLNDKRR